MATHQVNFSSKRTASPMYDMVMINATRRICADIPDLNCTITPEEVRITGELNDSDYTQYRRFISGGEQ